MNDATDTRAGTGIAWTGPRWAAAVLALLAAAAHLPVLPEHLREAPYVGAAFTVYSLAVLALAATILTVDSRPALQALGTLSVAAVLAYVASRLIAFPQIADDVGNWLDPWGLASVTTEAGCALAVGLTLRTGGQ